MAWPFRRRGKRKDSEEDARALLESLQKEVEQLRAQNQALQQSLAAAGTVAGEYLYRWRSVALPLLGTEWELRYFVLQGTNIRYYKSSKDVAFSPREEFSTLGCTVEWQGRQGTRLWVWALVDDSGSVMLRVGSPSEQSALKWVSALEEAGCTRRLGSASFSSTDRQLSLPATLGRRGMSSTGSFPSASDQSSSNLTGQPFTVGTVTAQQRQELISEASGRTPERRRSGAGKNGRTILGPKSPLGTPRGETEVDAIGGKAAAAAAARRSMEAPHGHTHGHGRQPRGLMLPSNPVNTATKISYLSSERMWHEKHTGVLNLMAVILIVTNFRLALENAMKYGWRYNPIKALRDLTIGNPNIPVALCYPVLMGLAALSLGSELLAYTLLKSELQLSSSLSKKEASDPKTVARLVESRRSLHEWLLFTVNLLVTSATIAVPWAAISYTHADVLSSGVLMCLVVVLWMKLVSFHHCCADLRNARRVGDVRPGERGSPSSPDEWVALAYPENLTPAALAYFLAAPTLSYQVNYPRSGPVRWKWLARRVGELVVMLTVLSIIVTQYMEPAIANSLAPLRQMDWLHVCERLLKLALPNTYCWLVMFYCLFHLWLNILAELLRFGDREFYKDWWNAPTLGDYWKLWNMPVHKWLLRHVYFPALRLGFSRMPAMVLVFFVSAVFHELVCGVPLHCVRLWAFTGIMLQVPMILLTEYIRKRLNRDEAGNYVFWLTFCVVGQPLSILLYAHDYYHTHLGHLEHKTA